MNSRVLPIVVSLVVGLSVASGAAQDKPDIRPRNDLRGHRGAVQHLAFHPNGKLLASADAKGRIRLWDLETSRVVRQIFPRGRSVNDQSDLRLAPRRIESMAFSPNGEMIGEVAADSPRATALRLWNPDDGQEIRLLAQGVPSMRCLAFTPDCKLIATNVREAGTWRHKIILRDIETGKIITELREERLAAALITISPDGKTLASAGGRNIHIWNLPERKLVHKISSHERAIQSICFSPDGKLLASASTDDTVRVWNVETGKQMREIEAEQDGVLALAYSPNGRTIASAGADKTIKLWKTDTGTMRARLWGHLEKVLCLAYSPDGKTLASGSGDTTIALWEVGELEEQEVEEEDEEDWEDDFWEEED